MVFAGLSYVAFVATLAYAVFFLGNIAVPKTIDSGAAAPIGEALAVNLALLAIFALQHTIMARRGFKRWWTKIVPESAERSSFVLASSAALALLFWQWQPMPEPVIWKISDPLGANLLWILFWAGWGIGLVSTFLIDHFELFGLRQPAANPQFRTPMLYRYVRHPLYLGMIIAFWSTPVMTAGHLLFAIGATAYIFVGTWFEERDLVRQFGETYQRYRREVGMLLPWRRKESR